ncbi:hypothetical protein Q5P01_020991 [Channa striata]|uniref:Death domain-containing protein n=1 Tax=Channa striata TaxID=64152 RepID=A0AA88S2B4_CHASR|nr:hypothetical protein Q5P01_020991 [Channa striata]
MVLMLPSRSFKRSLSKREKIHKEADVRSLPPSIPAGQVEDEKASVISAREPKIEITQTSMKDGKVAGTPKKIAAEVKAKGEVQQIRPERQEVVSHTDSTQHAEIGLTKGSTVQTTKLETKQSSTETTVEQPKEVKDAKRELRAQLEDTKVFPKDLHEAPQSVDEKSDRVEKSYKGAEVLVLQPDQQASIKEHKITSVVEAEAPQIGADQISVKGDKVPEKKDLTSSDVQSGKSAVEETPVQVKVQKQSQPEHLVKLATHGVDAPLTVVQEKSVKIEKIHKEADVRSLPPSIPAGQVEDEKASVISAREPKIEITQTSMKDGKVAGTPKKIAAEVKAKGEVQQIRPERQEVVSHTDSTQHAEIGLTKGSTVQTTKLETKQSSTETTDLHEAPQSVDEKSDRVEKSYKGAEVLVLQPDQQASIKQHTVYDVSKGQDAKCVKKDETHISLLEFDKFTIRTNSEEVQEKNPDLLSGICMATKAQIDRDTIESIAKAEELKEDHKGAIQEQQRETTVRIELENVPLQAATAVTTSEVRLQGYDLPQEQVFVVEKISPVSWQIVKTLSTDVVLGEVIPGEGLPIDKDNTEATAVKPEETLLDAAEGSTIFTEIHLLAGAGPSTQLMEGAPLEDAPEALITSTSDLDTCLSKVVSEVLSYKNHPAELSIPAMAWLVKEAQQCSETAQVQLSLLSQQKGADGNRDALEHAQNQWRAAAQDAAAIIRDKEAQLQLVTDYCTQIQTAMRTMERQTAELKALEMSPEQSSSKEAEQLRSLQRSMEEKGVLLRELFASFAKLSPHLSRSERATAHTELKSLQEKWRGMERAVDRSLHHTEIHSHEIRSLLLDIIGLQKKLEIIGRNLDSTSLSVTQWNCKIVQQLMEANAELKAAQQTYLHLQQQSEALIIGLKWEKETKDIQQGLQMVKDKTSHLEELVSSQTQNSSNPIMEKIIVVMRDGLAWARQTESDIEGRTKRVALRPEEVHRQLRDLKKLQSDVMTKQGQLEALVEEVTDLLPQLDQAEEVPMVRSLLGSLEELSKSTTEKLANAVKEMESGLQTREKLSEQIADLDSWVVAHLHREASRKEDTELKSPTELDRRVRQIQETLAEAEKHVAVCEALLIKSRDISPELSLTENCQLFEKLTNLQEDIKAISKNEKGNKSELHELIQTVELGKKSLVTIEKRLRQMMLDVSRHKFPITKESLQALKPFKQMILEHSSQVSLMQPLVPQEKTRGLHSIISELHSKMEGLAMKAHDHERYLNMRQHVEDLKENIEEQVKTTKEDSTELREKYKVCQSLLLQFPLVKFLCKEVHSKLQIISADLYPSQLTTERQRLKQNEENLKTLEMMLNSNLSIIEWNVLKDLDLESERKSTQAFLRNTQQRLQRLSVLEPNETAITKEYQKIMCLKKTVESRIRALNVLEEKKGNGKGGEAQDLKNAVLSQCDTHMENILQARESLRGYTCNVKKAVRFLRGIEVSLLPLEGFAGLCSEQLEVTQQALAALQQQFQTHVEQLQSQTALHSYLSPQKVEQLQENILSQLLVRMSTLQAKGHAQLEHLSRCAEHHVNYIRRQEEIVQSVKSTENSLLHLMSQKVTCLDDCTDQEAKLRALCEDVESLRKHLDELKEWCPELSCRGGREASVSALWKRAARLRWCTQELQARSEERVREWREITNSVEKASTVLEQVEAELPGDSHKKVSTEALHDLLQTWEQYHDRLDCEHRSLSALELRAARLLGVPAHLEKAPPTPLCQQLQAMQARYATVKKKSREGLEAARTELEEREKVREQLHCILIWLETTDGLLSEMEQSNSTQELPEIHTQLYTQKALLQRIMESLKMKYSDMHTPVPVEIDGQLQAVRQSLQRVEVKVGEAVERGGPVHRLGAKLCEIQAGLRSVQRRLELRNPTLIEAKITQKRVWDELDVWHSCLAALEVDMQDLEKPEDTLILTERLVEVQQFHSQLAKQAEQRTTLLSKIHTWLQEHKEMIKSSKSWMAEAQSWLAAPYSYTTAKCLSSHVQALQMVLNDSAQIRTTLQGFGSVLEEMSQVCETTTLQEQLDEADHQVANVQDNFTAPLSQLEHAAAEVEAIESEVKQMENQVSEIKTFLSSPETFPSPREESLKEIEQRIQSMRRTVAEIQKCKPGLCLPDKAEETLTVFTVVEQLQTLLLELEKKVPALFIQQPPTPVQAKASSAQQTSSEPQLLKSTSEEVETEETEQGQIRIVHVEEDVLTRSGATLLSVEQSSPEQAQSLAFGSTEREHQGVLQAEEAGENKGSEEQRVEEGGGGILWWLWDVFLGTSPQEPVVSEEPEAATGQSTEQTEKDEQDVEGPTDTPEASSSEALSKPLATVRTQSQSESMELMKGQSGLAWRGDGSHPEGLKTHRGLEQPGFQSGPCPSQRVLHGFLDRVGQLELWLQKAQRSLVDAGSPAMQDGVEQQLLTCQEMLLEIERKVASLSSLQLQDDLGAAGSLQETAELLSSKLELLKVKLLSFQQLLQDRQGEERTSGHRGSQERAQHRPAAKLQRSSSVQEIFSSPRNRLLRQCSLQQQKELEQELSEQRGLTQAIARHGSRADRAALSWTGPASSHRGRILLGLMWRRSPRRRSGITFTVGSWLWSRAGCFLPLR